MKAKFKNSKGSESFEYSKDKDGRVTIASQPKGFEVITEAEFNARFDDIPEPVAVPETTPNTQ